jgi:hypothetical protein
MPISEDSRAALALLKEVQQSVRDTEDLKNNAQVRADVISSSDTFDLNGKCFWAPLSVIFIIVGVSVRLSKWVRLLSLQKVFELVCICGLVECGYPGYTVL